MKLPHHPRRWLSAALLSGLFVMAAAGALFVQLDVLGALALGARQRWSLLLGWAAALAGTGLLHPFLKGIFRRLRPQVSEPWITDLDWSFPSGHAMGPLSCTGFWPASLPA